MNEYKITRKQILGNDYFDVIIKADKCEIIGRENIEITEKHLLNSPTLKKEIGDIFIMPVTKINFYDDKNELIWYDACDNKESFLKYKLYQFKNNSWELIDKENYGDCLCF